MKRLLVLIFCAFLGIVCADKLGKSCTTPDGRNGVGKLYRSCSELRKLGKSKENQELINKSWLENTPEGKIVVCCPTKPKDCQSQRENVPGSCIFLEECLQLHAMYQKKPWSSKTRSFLVASQCGFVNGKAKVCCADDDIDNPNFVDEEPEAQRSPPTAKMTTTTTTQAPPPPPGKSVLADKLKTSKLLPKAPNCGTELQKRIFGGDVTTIYEFNWLVLLEYKKPNDLPNGFHCGGSLINDKYVLTAAHCSEKIDSSWELFSVRVGEHDLQSDPDCDPDDGTSCLPPVQNIEIAEIIIHPDYSKDNRDSLHDIALLRLKRKVKSNEFMKPVCLPLTQNLWDKDYTREEFKVAGWGKTENQKKSPVKLFVKVPFVNLDDCQQKYSGRKTIQDKQMCAGGERGKDSCNGDSGGPLMAKDLSSPLGPYYIAGIVSYGAAECGTEGMPGVYTKVADYLEWIVDTVRA